MGLGQVRVWERNRFALTRTASIRVSFGWYLRVCFALCLGCLLYVVCGETCWLSVCDGACRRDSKRQLQPVPGGDVWDWVR